MSWIKDNKFVATLGGVTLVGAVALIGGGVHGCQKVGEEKEKFDAASQAVEGFETAPLYPKEENLNGKKKTLAEYLKQTADLQTSFDKYRTASAEGVTSQEFADHLNAAVAEAKAAFTQSKTQFPDRFFLGFEEYTGPLARESATGVLDYQLGAVKNIMLSLAAAAPSELLNVHRPKLPEETGQAFKAEASQVARPLPLEITFKGTERSAREFLSALGKNENQFVVIRSIRVANQKLSAPLATDAKFETPAPSATSGTDGGFVVPGTDSAPAEGAAPAAPAAPSGQILAPVLGSEEIYVFVRLDILQFLPAQPLPKP